MLYYRYMIETDKNSYTKGLGKNLILKPPFEGTILDLDNSSRNPYQRENKKAIHFPMPKEYECPPASLRGHIVKAHLRPDILCRVGVARYDIELARYREISLDWVVVKALQRLEEADAQVMLRMQDSYLMFRFWDELTKCLPLYPYWSVDDYRRMIARNLMYMENLGRASIDWERAIRTVPDVQLITFDIEKASNDEPFSPTPFLNESPKLIKSFPYS